MGHATVQRGNAHCGTGHLTWVGTGAYHGVGGQAVGREMALWGCHDQRHGDGASGDRILLALAALSHKAGDKVGNGVAASVIIWVGWQGSGSAGDGTSVLWHVVALLGTAPSVSEVTARWVGIGTRVAQDAVGEQILLALLLTGAARPQPPACGGATLLCAMVLWGCPASHGKASN